MPSCTGKTPSPGLSNLRSQQSFSCHNRWSDVLAARRPTFVKASLTISLSITAVCSSGKHGIGGILHFHVGIDKDSDCTIIGLYSFKSHGITCNFLLCLEFQQNWVCKEKASGVSGVLVDHSSKIACSRSSLVRLQLICTIRNWRLRRKISCHRWRRHCPRWQR